MMNLHEEFDNSDSIDWSDCFSWEVNKPKSGPMTQEEFEENFNLDQLPSLFNSAMQYSSAISFHNAMERYGYEAYLKGYNQDEGSLLNPDEFEQEHRINALMHFPTIMQGLILAYAYSAYIRGYKQLREERDNG